MGRFLLIWVICLFFSHSVFANMADSSLQSSSTHSDKVPISVLFNWHHQFEYAGFYAAQMLGLYKNAGLEVDLHDWKGEDIVESVLSGQFDIGVDGSRLIEDYLQGRPVKLLFSSAQYSPLVLLSHVPVESLSELEDKRIMLVRNYEVLSLIYLAQVELTELKNRAKLEDFIQHKTDLYSAYITNEPFQLKDLGVPFYIVDPKDYGVESFGDLTFTCQSFARGHPEALMKFRQATIEGWRFALKHPQQVVDYIIAHYSVYKSRKNLLEEARVTKRYVQPFSEARIGEISEIKVQKIAEDMVKMGMIASDAIQNLDFSQLIFNSRQSLKFSEAERSYLQQHPVLKIGSDIDWAPFEYIDKDGNCRGIAADYLALVSKKLGVAFEPNVSQGWTKVLEETFQGRLDFLSAAVATPERQKYLNFTSPYLTFPMVLVSRETLDYIPHLKQLSGETIAVTKGYASEEYLKTYYPQLKVLPVSDVQQGLQAVLNGEAIGYLGNLAVINYAIRTSHLDGLKVVGDIGEQFKLAMGVPKDNPILLSILQKVQNQITDAEKQAILNKWLPLKMVKEVDNRKLWQLLAIALLVIIPLLALLIYVWRLKQEQQRYIKLINELTIATVMDMDSLTLVDASDSYCELVGLPRSEIIGQSVFSYQKFIVPKEEVEAILERLRAGEPWKGQIEEEYRDGRRCWIELSSKPYVNRKGKVERVYSTRRDITAEKKVEQLSRCDELTQVYNRRMFNQKMPEELKRACRDGKQMAFVMMDIDFFKKLNDTYGHQQGDKALQKVASTIKQHFSRSNDFVFRMGGEEFGVITYEEGKALTVHLEQFRQAVHALCIPNQNTELGVLTLSVGAVVVSPHPQTKAEVVYRQADDALYQAKKQGRNRVVIHQSA